MCRSTKCSHRDVSGTMAAYGLYKTGLSLEQVADRVGIARQGLWDRFRRQQLPMRPDSKKKALPVIEFDGKRYASKNRDGYFLKTTGDREPLHRDMWRKAHGRIKRGWVVYFVDGDPMNITLDNLECVPKGEEIRPAPIKTKPCLQCRQPMPRRLTGANPEGPAAYAARKTCGRDCRAAWYRGRPARIKMTQGERR